MDDDMVMPATDDAPQMTRMPATAAWLGGLGLVPFIGLSLASVLATGSRAAAVAALLGYGAVILSFLGGIHWGAEMIRATARSDRSIDPRWLVLSVVPSLAGWAALLLDLRYGLGLLAACFAAQLLIDLRATHRGLMPAWYPVLRKRLTTVVLAALIVSLLGT